MPIFDEAAAVEAPKEGSPEYLVMVCHQHMAWLTVYAEGMTQADWRDMQDRLVSQIGRLKTDFAALAALLGGWRTMESAPKDGTVILLAHAGRTLAGYYAMAQAAIMVEADRRYPWEFLDSTNGTNAIANPTHWMPLPPSPDMKGGE